MKLSFNFSSVKATEFGVGREEEGQETFSMIAVDKSVQTPLQEMAAATWAAMQNNRAAPSEYEPSEKYSGIDYVYLPIEHELANAMGNLHSATNLPLDSAALEEPGHLFCYFAKFVDSKGQRLTAVRRATQFKGVLKSRLVQLVTDALKLVEDRTFKLDNDFDMLIDSQNLHILRPSGFEFIGKLQDAILSAVPKNLATIQKDIPYVDFSAIGEYASAHPRAARYLASIRGQKETKNIDQAALKKHCKSNGVEINMSKGMIVIGSGHEMGFLEVLDRRRYDLELVSGAPERYKASSRRKIDG